MTIENKTIFFKGDLDSKYLRDALARAGETCDVNDIELEKLNGGRTGAQVHKVTAAGKSYVVKRAPINSWQQENMGSQGEGPLWLSGALDRLPAPLVCPTIDTVYHRAEDAWWMLMDDVSTGIRPRGQFGETETLMLWRALAHLHADYWGKPDALNALPVVDLRETTKILAEPVSFAAGEEARETWVPKVVEEFMPLRVLLPVFLELLSPEDAAFYIELTKNRDWHKGLDDATLTLLHGDLRRANIAFVGDNVSLFDWEFAARGPAACDLQWSSFLTFWAYTPNDGVEPWERDHLREAYLKELESRLGKAVDRSEFQKTWDLGWLRIISVLGFCFADADLDNPEERGAVINRATVSIQMCRDILSG